MYLLKKLFSDSENDVVFNNDPIGKSLKYAGIQYSRCVNIVVNQDSFCKPYWSIMVSQVSSNSSGSNNSDHMQESKSFFNSSLASTLLGTFSGSFIIMCHMHQRCLVLVSTRSMASFIPQSWSVIINLGAKPIHSTNSLSNQENESAPSFDKKPAPNVTGHPWLSFPVNGPNTMQYLFNEHSKQ